MIDYFCCVVFEQVYFVELVLVLEVEQFLVEEQYLIFEDFCEIDCLFGMLLLKVCSVFFYSCLDGMFYVEIVECFGVLVLCVC